MTNNSKQPKPLQQDGVNRKTKDAKVLLIDLHNTIVDELIEYGGAIDCTIDSFITSSGHNNISQAQRNEIYKDLQQAHIKIGDDWDNRAFDIENASTLRNLFPTGKTGDAEYEQARKKAIAARYNYSQQYITHHAYTGVVTSIIKAHEEGHHVFVVTDATEQALHPNLKWLGLEGKISGAYCCGSPNVNEIPDEYRTTSIPVTPFKNGMVKPNAMIIGQIVLDIAKQKGFIKPETEVEDIFAFQESNPNVENSKRYIHGQLQIKDTDCRNIIGELIKQVIGIGDDLRDLVMYSNASSLGVKSLKANYSDDIPNMGVASETIKQKQKEGKEILKCVTGWSKERLELLQDFKQQTELQKCFDDVPQCTEPNQLCSQAINLGIACPTR